jgi:hypothetical protein
MGNARIKELTFKTGDKYHIIPCSGGARIENADGSVDIELSLASPTLLNEIMIRFAPSDDGGRKVSNCSVSEIPDGSEDREEITFGDVVVTGVEELRGTQVAIVPEGTPGLTGFRVKFKINKA